MKASSHSPAAARRHTSTRKRTKAKRAPSALFGNTKLVLLGRLGLSALLVLLVGVWILGAIYITTSASSLNDTAASGGSTIASMLVHSQAGGTIKSPPISDAAAANKQQEQQQKHHHGLRRRERTTTTPTTNTSSKLQMWISVVNNKDDRGEGTEEMIDMRNLTGRTLAFDDVDGGVWKQGWNVEPVRETAHEPLHVYVVPHSHCDPGWIKTFDEYFQEQTKTILTTVVNALLQDDRRKFVWAEISYFEWWWREQSEEMRNNTLTLLNNGQLEFVTAGWVQPDEANTQLYAMRVQLQEGHDFIRNELDAKYIPKFAWSIDPFGYSPTMAFLLKEFGFEGMLIQRVHYAVKKELAQRKHLEFMWRQTWDDSSTANTDTTTHEHQPPHEHDVFCHVMPFFSYDVPHTCGPDPSVCCQFDFARLNNRYGGCPWHKPPKVITQANVKERSLLLLDQYRKKAALYRTNVVLAPLGDDFRYMSSQEAAAQYQNYQLIMDYVNANVDHVTIEFGTLSEYFRKVQGTFDVPVLKGSFFTYADRQEDYWSGYFTSRIFDKALDRKLERVLFAAESLGATRDELQKPRRALSLFQHHDGVTGTAKDHVVRDYAKRIHDAIHDVQDVIMDKLRLNSIGGDGEMEACWQSDAPRGLSQNLCEGTIHVYNPLETSQYCGDVEVHGRTMAMAQLPCEFAGAHPSSDVDVRFDPATGLMTHPIQEHWMVWKVQKGGAYLFHPGHLDSYKQTDLKIELGGYIVWTRHWKRTVIVHEVTDEFGAGQAKTVDFVYETNLQRSNEEWFVRFSSSVQNKGVFHTDLNGFNFDTHYFRKDLPIQSQVFPMPTLASIEDDHMRMTVLSEHAQGTASLEDGSIDVWLDRRLSQDDGRGLFQGVMDNVPTRTRLRLLLEEDGYSKRGEFDITPLCRRMWDELNHPLEMFGEPKFKTAQEAEAFGVDRAGDVGKMVAAAKAARAIGREAFDVLTDPERLKENISERMHEKVRSDPKSYLSVHQDAPIVPFVYMVHKRLDCLKLAVDTLRHSDFDRQRVPLIVSHDGHVPEVVSFVEELKSEFNVIQIFHPYSCLEHPTTFPGNDESLNVGYSGDRYGNKRNGMVTCCKHHFTWMIKTVFDMEFPGNNVEDFALFEEDYVVSPTIYETVVSGLSLYHDLSKDDDYFGIVLEGRVFKNETFEEGWDVKPFKSGPLVLSRDMWTRLVENANEYCTYDDYNWDWSMVHLMNEGLLPFRVLYPTIPQTMHVGVEGGIHRSKVARWQLFSMLHTSLPHSFHGTKFVGSTKKVNQTATQDAFGGWGHPADVKHCLRILSG